MCNYSVFHALYEITKVAHGISAMPGLRVRPWLRLGEAVSVEGAGRGTRRRRGSGFQSRMLHGTQLKGRGQVLGFAARYRRATCPRGKRLPAGPRPKAEVGHQGAQQAATWPRATRGRRRGARGSRLAVGVRGRDGASTQRLSGQTDRQIATPRMVTGSPCLYSSGMWNIESGQGLHGRVRVVVLLLGIAVVGGR